MARQCQRVGQCHRARGGERAGTDSAYRRSVRTAAPGKRFGSDPDSRRDREGIHYLSTQYYGVENWRPSWRGPDPRTQHQHPAHAYDETRNTKERCDSGHSFRASLSDQPDLLLQRSNMSIAPRFLRYPAPSGAECKFDTRDIALRWSAQPFAM